MQYDKPAECKKDNKNVKLLKQTRTLVITFRWMHTIAIFASNEERNQRYSGPKSTKLLFSLFLFRGIHKESIKAEGKIITTKR
jgi:hypothetical protein